MNKELELEAEKSSPMYEHIMDLAACQSVKRASFIEGAISDEAREYWYKQFEKQKLEFAMAMLNRARDLDIQTVYSELKQNMNEYKLINLQTKKEHLCDKITIEGFDYYVGDITYVNKDEIYYDTFQKELKTSNCEQQSFTINKIIATNNPNIDIPKVVDAVEKLKLVYNEGGNKDIFTTGVLTGIEIGYNKSQETHPNSDEDMIEFNKWQKSLLGSKNDHWLVEKSDKELLQLWKKHRPKIVYYE